jgi:hypothetical protein
LEIALELGEEKHPADEIALALSRAGGILSSLSHCYDVANTDFAVGSAFLAEAIKTTESILMKANESLTRLYENYSLATLQDEQADALVRAANTSFESESENISALNFVSSKRRSNNAKYETQSTETSHLADESDVELEYSSEEEATASVEMMMQQPAQSYQELLEKLTSMVDAASYKSADDDGQLLPVLESLRSDVMRLKTA